mgnify:CR=1 FL=1
MILKTFFIEKGLPGIDIDILYADDIVIFANDSSELQSSLDVLLEYCQRLKLKVNIKTTKKWYLEKVVDCHKTLDSCMMVRKLKL